MVKVRLTGDPDEVEAMASRMEMVATVTGRSRPYPNRHDDGVRVYLEVELPRDDVTDQGDRRHRIVCLDTETTGLNPAEDEILTLSIIDAETDEVLLDETYRPVRATSWSEAQAVNHISPEMVAGCPPIANSADRIRAVLGDAELVIAYNVAFDLPFLEAAIGDLPAGLRVSDPMIDYAKVHGEWSERYGEYKWQRLTVASAAAGHVWTGEAHGSLADARATADVWRWLDDQDDAEVWELGAQADNRSLVDEI